jgi:hypothetical protein
MVGINRKVIQLAKLLQKYSPILDEVAPGLGTLVGSVAGIGETIADGVNNVYENYTRAKRKGKKYNFTDGVESFMRPSAASSEAALKPNTSVAPSVVNSLSKSYGGLHPRLKLKDELQEDDKAFGHVGVTNNE